MNMLIFRLVFQLTFAKKFLSAKRKVIQNIGIEITKRLSVRMNSTKVEIDLILSQLPTRRRLS